MPTSGLIRAAGHGDPHTVTSPQLSKGSIWSRLILSSPYTQIVHKHPYKRGVEILATQLCSHALQEASAFPDAPRLSHPSQYPDSHMHQYPQSCLHPFPFPIPVNPRDSLSSLSGLAVFACKIIYQLLKVEPLTWPADPVCQVVCLCVLPIAASYRLLDSYMNVSRQSLMV